MKTSSPLTRRKREVARLVAHGLTNREIANKLFISERTADYHLEQIRNKLGFGTRAQIATWITEQGANGEDVPEAPGGHALPARHPIARRRLWSMIPLLIVAVVASSAVALVVHPWSTSPSGPTVKTIAGRGSVDRHRPGGHTGDGGQAIYATLSRPTDVVATHDGTIYIADFGNGVVRRITSDGTITTWAGGGSALPTNGAAATTASLGLASNLTVDSQGNLYLLSNVQGVLEVWLVRPDSTMTRVVSLGQSGGGSLAFARNLPMGGLVIASDGTLYIADRAENRVWRRAPDGTLSVFAGTGSPGYSGDNGAAIAAQIDHPIGLALDRGKLYIADSGNNCIRKVDLATTAIATVAGICGTGYADSGDGGPALQARLSFPFGVAVGKDGSIFIADTGNNRIRQITHDGRILALVGRGRYGFIDGGPAQAEFAGPEAVALDAKGDLLVADTENHRVRELPRVSR